MAYNATHSGSSAPSRERVCDWSFFTMLDAYADRGPTQYAIDGLFALPSLNIVYGAPGCHKSLLMADAAVCVASGRRWLESPFVPNTIGFGVSQRAAVWLDFDNGARLTHQRLGALGRAYECSPDIPLRYVSMPSPHLNISCDDHIDDLLGHVRAMAAQFVVLDNLGRISGGLDENSNEMDRVMQGLRRLAEDTGAAVVVIHHQRKKQNTAAARRGDMLRGHSSIEAALDLALHVQGKEKDPSVTITATKARGPQVMDFGAVFEFEHRDETQDLARAWFVGTLPDFFGREGLAVNKALEVLSTGRTTKTDLRKAVRELKGVSDVTFEKILPKLEELGIVARQEDYGSAHRIWYNLADR